MRSPGIENVLLLVEGDHLLRVDVGRRSEGIVPGAGLALLRAIDAVEREEAQSDGDERTGLRILKRALEVPTR